MASKENICTKHYESDSSGKKPDKRRVEDKQSLEILHLSYTEFSDISIVHTKKLYCICFGVLLGGFALSGCTSCLL